MREEGKSTRRGRKDPVHEQGPSPGIQFSRRRSAPSHLRARSSAPDGVLAPLYPRFSCAEASAKLILFEIVPITVEDLPSILEIEQESQPEPWSRQLFMEELERPCAQILVAKMREIPHALLGYICFWKVADEIQILNIAVHRNYRRQGIGCSLLQQALLHGCEKKAQIAVLEVRRDNAAARKLYESIGFKVVGERPNYYGLHEAAIIMELEL